MWFFKKRTFIFILTICFTFLSCNKNSDKQNRIYLEDFLTWAPCTQNSLVEEIKGNKNAFTEFKKFDENAENIDEILEALEGKTFQEVDGSLLRHCPVCNAKMVKNFSSARGEVMIDECYAWWQILGQQ